MATPKPITKNSSNDHVFVATDLSTLTESSIVNIGGITNTIGTFVKAGVVRKTANGYSHAVENDPKVLSVHNLL
jgi:hypothetical protein